MDTKQIEFNNTVLEAIHTLESWNFVKPYRDMYSGELEQMRSDIYQLQESVTLLLGYLHAKELIDIEELGRI